MRGLRLKRIQDLLAQEEILSTIESTQDEDNAVELENANFIWDVEDKTASPVATASQAHGRRHHGGSIERRINPRSRGQWA